MYGQLTKEAVARAEIVKPNVSRTICMAVTTADSRDRGQPSSWSAALDQICFGDENSLKRLFIVSAGNLRASPHEAYPDGNLTEGIKDPGQSWNALTVGAFTERDQVTEPDFSDWSVLAPVGDLCPTSTTSLIWETRKWPLKPDFVMEGGNMVINEDRSEADFTHSLSLLTTSHRHSIGNLFTSTGETSAAAAAASRLAASISAQYPWAWPETVRALITHSCRWTPAMTERFPPINRTARQTLLRVYGHGVPDPHTVHWSANNDLVLIAQGQIQPFFKNKMHEINIHDLPWPQAELMALAETDVRLKVTLSYFIEPNPARRGWTNKHRYQSHGLRFDVKTPHETREQFRTRLNRALWDEELGRESATTQADTNQWYFGTQIRTKGSLHCDTWTGSAADLAERGCIAVYPVIGWWRERHQLNRWIAPTRYSLVISIQTPEEAVDLYTPIANQIAITTQP